MSGISIATFKRAAKKGCAFEYHDGSEWVPCIDRHHAAAMFKDNPVRVSHEERNQAEHPEVHA